MIEADGDKLERFPDGVPQGNVSGDMERARKTVALPGISWYLRVVS